MEKRRVKRDAKSMIESRVPLTSSLDDETVRNVTRHLVLDGFVSETRSTSELFLFFLSFLLFNNQFTNRRADHYFSSTVTIVTYW